MAWTRVAANLLTNGNTVHSTFRLPLEITEQSTCNIKPNSKEGHYLKNVKVIIWDEISMASKLAFEAIDTFLRDLCNEKEPFGGKIIIISGDFRQILPVVKHGSRSKIIESCVKKSKLWIKFKKFTLHDNLRLNKKDEHFQHWLLNVGENKNATKFELNNDLREIPKEFICEGDLITDIFGEIIDPNDESIFQKIIIAPLNKDIIKLNEKIVDRIQGESRTYLSIDSVESENDDNLTHSIPIEFLNSLTPNSLPSHELV